MLTWRIYYGDGTTFSNEDGSPFNAPTRNVQGIVHHDVNVGKKIVAKKDVYWWNDVEGCWYGCADRNLIGFWDYLGEAGTAKYILIGRSISDEQYDAVIKQMINDPDFPVKSALLPDEEI